MYHMVLRLAFPPRWFHCGGVR